MERLLIHLVFVIDAALWTPDEISLTYSRLQNAAQFWQAQGYNVEIEPSTLWEMRFIPQAEQSRGEELWSLLGLTTSNAWAVITAIFSSGNSVLRVNGVQSGTDPDNLFVQYSETFIGGTSTYDNTRFTGDIGEIWVFSGAVGLYSQMETWLNAKWA